ncbi:MAG: DUF885 family protein [Phycisphaerae bacterium]
MRTRSIGSALIVWVTFVFSAAASAGDPAPARHAALHKLFHDYWEHRLRNSPERATYLGDHRYDDRLSRYDEASRLADIEAHKTFRRRLAAIPAARLSPADALNAELFARVLRERIELAEFPEHLMPIKQQDAPQITLGMIQQTHPFKTPRDCANYAARLDAFPRQVDEVIAQMREGLRRGVVRSKITIEQSLPQIDVLIVDDPVDCELYAPAKSFTASQGGDEMKQRVREAAHTAIGGLRRLRAFLKDTYLPACRETVGYGLLPDGKRWYRRLARHHTTTSLTPEAIHQLGLDELKHIHAGMRKVMAEVEFTGDLGAFIDALRNDPAQHNKTAAEIMRRHAANLRRSDAHLPELFGVLPKTPYELKEMEPFRAPAAPAAYYYNAPDDGSRPAYFYVNTYRPETRPIYTMEALAYHEAMPGHHLQLGLAQEKKGWPDFRRFEGITAFIEGWALYAERLGYELGGYRDPYARFGQLTYDAWRASRLVVDTGIHYFGWSRDRAIAFMKANTALSDQNIRSEIDRYIAWPGQALAYKVGQLEILKLRRRAERTLADRFDVRAFHDALLAEGSLPLSTLRTRMIAWIERRADAPSVPGARP